MFEICLEFEINHINNVSFVIIFISVVVEEPEFTEVIENVTVPAGRNVKLACSVKNLGSYKVSLFHSYHLWLEGFKTLAFTLEKNNSISIINEQGKTVKRKKFPPIINFLINTLFCVNLSLDFYYGLKCTRNATPSCDFLFKRNERTGGTY